MIITGKLNRNAPAHIGPKSRLYADKNPARPTVNVLAFVLVRRRATRKSFYARNRVKINAVASPGLQIGRITLQKVCKLLAPSIYAASSSVVGTPS